MLEKLTGARWPCILALEAAMDANEIAKVSLGRQVRVQGPTILESLCGANPLSNYPTPGVKEYGSVEKLYTQ